MYTHTTNPLTTPPLPNPVYEALFDAVPHLELINRLVAIHSPVIDCVEKWEKEAIRRGLGQSDEYM